MFFQIGTATTKRPECYQFNTELMNHIDSDISQVILLLEVAISFQMTADGI